MKSMTSIYKSGVLIVALTMIAGCPLLTPVPAGTPVLQVFPRALGFGDLGTVETFNIFNEGGGTLSYTVTTNAPWLRIDTPTGTVTTETDRIRITALRDSLSPGDFTGTITITTNGGTETIPVTIGVGGTPLLQTSPSQLNLFGTVVSGLFSITNAGDDDLPWTIQAIDLVTAELGPLPDFLSATALDGVAVAGGSSQVTITVDPNLLPAGAVSVTLIVTTSAGTAQVVVNTGDSNEPGEISVDPAALDFGETTNTDTFEVFNSGPEGSVLNFQVTSDNPAIVSLIDPAVGTSIGSATESSVDRRTVSVTIDRSQLTADGVVANLTVSAEGVDETVSIPISATRAPLTLEGASNRSRPPFILRFVFLIRDALGMPVDPSDPATLEAIRDGLTIEEDNELLDLDETNFFLQAAGAAGGAGALRTNMAIVLDYSGSMFNAPPGNGALINQMVDSTVEFVQDLPSSYRIALYEHHSRNQPTFLLANFTTNVDPNVTDNIPATLVQALTSFSVPVGLNGGSQLYDATIQACEDLAQEDIGVAPLDDADHRVVVVISDGRDTSSVASLSEVISAAQDNQCRIVTIGFGQNVATDNLKQIAEDTGGHYYAAPTTADLVNILEDDTAKGAAAVGQLVKDLANQLVLTYISLAQGEGTYLISLELDGNSGSFQRNATVFPGDTRAGQISIASDAISGGSTELTIRTEYTPRAISQMRFRFFLPAGVAISSIDFAPDGIISSPDWVIIPEAGGDTFTAITNGVNAIPFASFGELFRVRLTGVLPDDEIGFRMDNRIYVDPPFTVYYAYPDAITLGNNTNFVGPIRLGTGGTFDIEDPFGLGAGFNPDQPLAFDRDEDLTADFEDPAPEDNTIPN